MKYQSKGSTKFLLMYHVIFVCKYRKKALIKITPDLKVSILKIAEKSNFTILEMETDKDHIHLLIESEPKISVSSIARILKQRTTHEMWQLHSSELRKYYWGSKRLLWSDGYFACSIGNASQDTISKYIQQQG